MTTEIRSQSLTANVQATFGAGRIFYIKSASGALTLTAENNGSSALVRSFINVTAGFKFTAEKGAGWSLLRVLSATSQTIEIAIGDDDVEFSNAVSIVGTSNVIVLPSTVITDTADATLAAAAQVSIASNTNRKRITVGVLSSSAASVRVSTTGGAGRGFEIQPGQFFPFETTAALKIYNPDSTNSATYYLEEET